jgi:hypothetical protein
MKGVTMKRLFLSVAFAASFLLTAQAHAQNATVPADEPASAIPAATPEPAPVVVPPVTSSSSSHESLITKGLREGLPMHVRQEQAFDANNDNRLEPEEIKAFLKSVYQETAKGPVKNTSDILYQFDKNKDGYIDRSEASGFSQYSL